MILGEAALLDMPDPWAAPESPRTATNVLTIHTTATSPSSSRSRRSRLISPRSELVADATALPRGAVAAMTPADPSAT